MISEETLEDLLKTVLKSLSQLDWGCMQADTCVQCIAKATQDYFSNQVYNFEEVMGMVFLLLVKIC